jgi:hypothetical protein
LADPRFQSLRRPCLAALIALFLGVPAWAPGPRAAQPERRIDLALYSLADGQLLYRGHRRVLEEEEGRTRVLTTFTTPAGTSIQETDALYRSDTLAPVNYSLDDLRSGESERLRVEGGRVFLAYRENREEKLAEDDVELSPNAVFTATVVPFLLRNWVALREGATLVFPFLVPSRQDVYAFRAGRDEKAGAGKRERIVIRMEPDSWFLRRLVDPLFFEFSTEETPRLLEFRGRSSLRDEDEDTQDLRMTYSYLEGG